jgi:hypothetical protein
MFASFSRIRIVKSNIHRKKVGLRKGSIGVVIASSFPSTIHNPYIIRYSVIISIVRAMFIRYGNERKGRAEIRDFINILPAIPVGSPKEVLDSFQQDLFPELIKFCNQTPIIPHLYLSESLNQRFLITNKLFIDNSYQIDNNKPLPFCVAVNDSAGGGEIDKRTWVRTAADLIRKQISFEDTTRIVGKFSLSKRLIPVLVSTEEFNEFLRNVEGGRPEVQEVINSMNTLVLCHRRNQFLNHQKRIKNLLQILKDSKKKEDKKKNNAALGILHNPINTESFLESIFKTIYTYSARSPAEIAKMNRPEFSRILDAIATHNNLQTT